jgi:hypothetical protein
LISNATAHGWSVKTGIDIVFSIRRHDAEHQLPVLLSATEILGGQILKAAAAPMVRLFITFLVGEIMLDC